MTKVLPDREHIIQLNSQDVQKLRKWLEFASGSLSASHGDVSFDAVQGGGLLVRTQPFHVQYARRQARIEAERRYCKESPTQEHNSVQALNGDTGEPMNFRMCGFCGRREW